MDCVIILYFDGSVSEQFELVGMSLSAYIFEPIIFNDLLVRVRVVMNIGCDVCLHERYDIGDNRLIYVMQPLRSEDE
jgi:hypothetical protein